ncbi:MAG: hypothetical protein J1F04_01205 [Oscillospiraceae bacterium]|nr:hypothetical protein [Oscillospiraceae bacterium]
MKIGNHTVKYSFKPARIISDIISLAMAAFSAISAASFSSAHPEIQLEMARMDLISLWVFPAVCAAVILIYIVVTLKSRRFEKYNITKDNAQSVFDWFVFAVSLCKLPLLFSAIEAEFIVEERLLGLEKSFFSVTFVLCALILVIIIRFSAHRITSLTKTDNKKSNTVFISSDVAEADEKKEKK